MYYDTVKSRPHPSLVAWISGPRILLLTVESEHWWSLRLKEQTLLLWHQEVGRQRLLVWENTELDTLPSIIYSRLEQVWTCDPHKTPT